MKLAIFSPSLLPVPAIEGGAVEELITYIIEENEKKHIYDIDLYTIDENDKLKNLNYKFTNIKKYKYHKNNLRSKFLNFINKISSRLPNGKIVSDFSEFMVSKYKTDYYDLVLVEDNRQILNSISRKVKKEKVFFHLHDDISLPDLKDNKLQILLHPHDLHLIQGISKTSCQIITVSHYLEDRIKRIGINNVTTLYNGIDMANFSQISEEDKKKLFNSYGITNDDIVFTFIGRFSPEKGLDILLSALRHLKEKAKIKVLIVGKNWLHSNRENKYVNKLKEIYNKLDASMQSKIKFTGYVNHDEIGKIYSISDCIVIPSRVEEAFGMVALEAISFGVPVIASDSGGLVEVVDSSCAIIVPKNNKFEINIAKAMEKLYDHPLLRKEMKINGLKSSNKFAKSKKEYFENFCKIVK